MFTPALREDVELIPGGKDSTGRDVFIIRDVIRNRYVEINYSTFRVLCFWVGGREVGAFCQDLLARGIQVGRDEIAGLISFLHRENLTRQFSREFTKHVVATREKRRNSRLKQVMESYLFFKIPNRVASPRLASARRIDAGFPGAWRS